MRYEVRYQRLSCKSICIKDFLSKKDARNFLRVLRNDESVKIIGLFSIRSLKIYEKTKKRFQEFNRKNKPNTLDIKGHRLYIKGTVGPIKKLLGKLVKKVRTATTSGYVEIIHTDNKGRIARLLKENGYRIEYGK